MSALTIFGHSPLCSPGAQVSFIKQFHAIPWSQLRFSFPGPEVSIGTDALKEHHRASKWSLCTDPRCRLIKPLLIVQHPSRCLTLFHPSANAITIIQPLPVYRAGFECRKLRESRWISSTKCTIHSPCIQPHQRNYLHQPLMFHLFTGEFTFKISWFVEVVSWIARFTVVQSWVWFLSRAVDASLSAAEMDSDEAALIIWNGH